jgi:hypothetical protein
MKLVKPQDLIKASPFIHYLGGEYFARILMHLLRFNKINDLYDKVSDVHGIDSINSLLEQLNVKIEIDEKDLKKLPRRAVLSRCRTTPLVGSTVFC